MQFERDTFKARERERERDRKLEWAKLKAHEREVEREITIELAKVDLARKKLQRVAEGGLTGLPRRPSPPPSGPGAGLSPMVRCVQGGVGGPVVWAAVPPLPVVDAEPVLSEGSDCAGECPDVAACTVARVVGRAWEADQAESRSCPVELDLPSELPRADLIETRRDDGKVAEVLNTTVFDGGHAAVATVDCGPVSPNVVAVDEDMIGPDDAVLRPRLENSETLANMNRFLNHLHSQM